MSQTAKIRQRQTPGAKRVLGLVLVVWLNMALQPCAMAFGDTSAQDCRNCPPTHTTEMSSQGAHESDVLATNTMCDSRLSQCLVDDEVNFDGRTAKVKDAPDDVPVGVVPFIAVVALVKGSAAPPTVGDPPHLSCGAQALNVLYCVYLI